MTRPRLLALLLVAAVGVAIAWRAPRTPPRELVNEKDGSVLLRVDGGPFIMGSDDDWENERPRHERTLPTYYIGRCDVTNEQYARFVAETGYKSQGTWRDQAGSGKERHPVVCVTREDAEAYCRWAGLRLPSEAEWEKAARGSDGRTWPWGNRWDRNRANSVVMDDPARLAQMAPMRGGRGTTPVGLFPEGASPCGALDMAGNVWQWCADTYQPYGPQASPDADYARAMYVARGGAWFQDGADCLRCARRLKFFHDYSIYIGFRVCRDALP